MLTFTRTIQDIDPLTGAPAPIVTTISGEAIVVRGNPQRYRELGLLLSTMPTLLFTPNGYPLKAFTPEFVLPGDVTTLNGVVMTVKDVDPVAPDGFVIIARIVVGV